MYDFSGLKVLADIPRQQAKKRGNSTAMHFMGRETTYAALDTRSSLNALISPVDLTCGPRHRSSQSPVV